MTQAKRRVKVYELSDDREWMDQGTGHVSSRMLTELWLEVRNENDASVMLETNVAKNTNFHRQAESLILWDEPDGRHLALSFQEPHSCKEIWQQICQETGIAEDLNTSEKEADLITMNLKPPPKPELSNLKEYADAVETVSHMRRDSINSEDIHAREQANKACELLAELVYDRGDIPTLFDLFEQSEDLEDLESLQHLYRTFSALLRLAEHSILNLLLEDDNLLKFVGTLEYDPTSERIPHRQHLTERCQLQEVVPITAPALKATIQRSYYLTYLKDVIFAGLVDDYLLNILESQVQFVGKDVIELVQQNTDYLKQILSIPTAEQQAEADRDKTDIQLQQAKFLTELFSHSAQLTMQQMLRVDVLVAACDNGLVPCLVGCLETGREDVIGVATGALVRALELDANKLRPYIYDPSKSPRPASQSSVFSNDSTNGHTATPNQGDGTHWELMMLLVKAFKTSTRMANVLLLGQAIGLLLDSETFDETDMHTNFKSGFLSKFYQQSGAFAQLVALFDELVKQRATEAGQERLMITLELIGKWVLPGVHSYHIKNYVLKHDVLLKTTRVLNPGNNSLLAVAGARLLSLIIREGRNQFYNSHIIKKNLLRPLMDRFRLNGRRNNLLNSTVLSILASVQAESSSRLFDYIAKEFREDLEALDYVETGQAFLAKLHDKDGTNTTAATDDVPSLTDSRRRFRPDGSMDRREEDYFNTDDDDDASSVASSDPASEPRPATATPDDFLKDAPRPRSSSLVDYDDDDDEMPVFKPTSKKPKMHFALAAKK